MINDVVYYDEKHYKQACKELLVILKYIPEADYKKIPQNVIQTLEFNAEQSYNFELDLNKNIKEQKISELTKAMIENFYRDYWVTDIEKEKILQEEKNKREELEKAKHEKYNPDNLFKKSKIEEKQEKIQEQLELVEYKENIFQKFLNKFKSLLKRN